MRTVAFCEIEPFARRVLARHWPEVPICHDIKTMEAYRTSEAPGCGFIRAGSFDWQNIHSVRGQSSVDVGCSPSQGENARQDQVAPQARANCNPQEKVSSPQAIPFQSGEDHQSTNQSGSETRCNLSDVRGGGYRHRPQNSRVARRKNRNGEPLASLSPLPPQEVQTGLEGGLSGSHADIGPIDVICGGFP
jgi:hypothetical protein